MLLDVADPVASARPAGIGDDLVTVDEHAPGIGVMEAEGDAHERRLPGPVLADDRADLAGAQVEGDVVVGDDPGIGLGDALEAEEGRRPPVSSGAAAPSMDVDAC